MSFGSKFEGALTPVVSFGTLTGEPGDNAALAAALALKLDKAGGTMTGALAITAGALNTAALSGSQTWNNAGVTCRGIEHAVADTNSAAGSTLMRLLGGATGVTEKFTVDKNGTLKMAHYGSNIDVYDTDGTTLRAYLRIGRWHARDFNATDNTASLGRDGQGGIALGSAAALIFSSDATWYGSEACRIQSGAGSPESVLAAPPGSLYLNRSGGPPYYKNTGTGNTGWVVMT